MCEDNGQRPELLAVLQHAVNAPLSLRSVAALPEAGASTLTVATPRTLRPTRCPLTIVEHRWLEVAVGPVTPSCWERLGSLPDDAAIEASGGGETITVAPEILARIWGAESVVAEGGDDQRPARRLAVMVGRAPNGDVARVRVCPEPAA